MRKITLLSASLTALALVACSDTTKEITSPDLNVSSIRNPTPTYNPNGPVWVLGDITLGSIGITGTAGQNSHPQGKGSCRDVNGDHTGTTADVIWYNSQGNPTGAPFCAGTSIATAGAACTIDETSLPGTYAYGNGGLLGYPADPQTANNENLNLHSDLIPQDTAQFIHYGALTKKGAKGTTTAKSQTAFSMTCDDESEWDGFISLGDLDGSSGNLFTSVGDAFGTRHIVLGSGITVSVYASGEGPYDEPASTPAGTGTLTSLYWAFRSRN